MFASPRGRGGGDQEDWSLQRAYDMMESRGFKQGIVGVLVGVEGW